MKKLSASPRMTLATVLATILLCGSSQALHANPAFRIKLGGAATDLSPGDIVSLGTTTVGQEFATPFRVFNDGSVALSTSNLSVPNGTRISANALASTIAAGSSDNFGLVVEADSPGTVTGVVSVSHSAPNQPSPFTFSITATVLAVPEAELRVQVGGSGVPIPYLGTIDVGSTFVGQEFATPIRIFNDGNADLVTANLTAPNGFRIGTNGLDPTIPAERSDNFGLILEAASAGTASGSVTFTHSAPNLPSPFQFTVTGTVAPLPAPSLRVQVGGTGAPIAANGLIDVGSTPFGEEVATPIRVFNDGDADLLTSNLTVASGFRIGANTLDPVIPPGSSDNFGLILEAAQAGTSNAAIFFSHDAPNTSSPFPFTARGTVLPPPEAGIRVELASTGTALPYNGSVGFGSTLVGQETLVVLRVHNDGDATLTTSNLTVPSGYRVSTNTLSPAILPGNSDDFGLVFEAPTLGTIDGEVSFAHNASNQPTPYLFTVTGNVVATPEPELRVELASSGAPLLYNDLLDFGTTTVGQEIPIDLRVVNRGNETLLVSSLSVPSGFRLSPDALDSEIAPDTSDEFGILLEAAATGLVEGEVHFTHNAPAQPTPFRFTVRGNVSGSPVDDARFITQNVPQSLVPGETRRVSVTFRNSGTTTWTRAGGYKIKTENPRDNIVWGYRSVNLDTTESIAPTQEKTFLFDITAPNSPGTYNFQWSLRHQGQAFGEWSENVAIQVQDQEFEAPQIDTISPKKLPLHTITTVTLTGSSLHGADVYVPTTAASGRTAPTILSIVEFENGTILEVDLDTRDSQTEGRWMLAVTNPANTDAIDFIVTPPGPYLEAFTPSQPVVGQTTTLLILGANLEGASVSCSNPALQITELDTSNDEVITGILSVLGSATPTTADFIVTNHGISVDLRVDLIPGPNESPGKKGPVQSPVYAQDLHWLRPNYDPPQPEAPSFCGFSFGRSIFSQTYALGVSIKDEDGNRGEEVFRRLTPGSSIDFGVNLLVFSFQVQFTASFDFCSGFSFQGCLSGFAGIEFVGITGATLHFTHCFPGGTVSGQQVSTPSPPDFRLLSSDENCVIPSPSLPLGVGPLNQSWMGSLEMIDCCPSLISLALNSPYVAFAGTETSVVVPELIVPLGLVTCFDFPVTVKTYIPFEFGLPPVPTLPTVSPTLFFVGDGDHRDCGGNSVRTLQSADVSQAGVGAITNYAAPTVIRSWTPPTGFPGPVLRVIENSNSEMGTPTATVESNGKVTVHFNGSARTAACALAVPPICPSPAIDWCIDVTLEQRPDGSVEYLVQGSHDDYPAYEVFIDGHLVYCSGDPSSNNLLLLVGGCSVPFTASGTLNPDGTLDPD